jgi:hypothetical protein
MRKALIGVLLFLSSTLAAQAADNGIYVGASIGQGNIDVDDDIFGSSGIDLDGDETGFKFIAGIRPLDWFGVELNYVDFGDVEDRTLQAKANGVSAFAVGFLAVGPVDLYAKAGLINWETTVSQRGLGDLFRDDGTDPAYGVGVQFRLLSFAIRAEYEKFDLDNVDDVSMLSVGVTYTFL